MGSQNFALFCAYEREDDLTISTSVGLIVFEFHGISFKTRPEGLVYRYRLKGYDEGWQTTNARRVEYQNVPRGTFTFEVQAVDQDLNYSEPASVTLDVVPDPHIQVLAEVLSQSGTKGEFVGDSQALREVQAKTAVRVVVGTENRLKEDGFLETGRRFFRKGYKLVQKPGHDDYKVKILTIGEPLPLNPGQKLKELIGRSGKLKKGQDYMLGVSEGITHVIIVNEILRGEAVLVVVE